MTDAELKKLQFDNFSLLLKKLLEEGHGEIVYTIKVASYKIYSVSLAKLNTYKMGSDIINT